MNFGIGTVLDGYCNGFFGRDSYEKKVIEAIGSDWIVVRENGGPNIAVFEDIKERNEFVNEWLNEVEEE